MDSGISRIRNWFYKEKFTFLLCGLFLYTIAAPFFEVFLHKGIFARISFLIVLFAAVFAVSANKKDLILIFGIACLSTALLCIKFYFKNGDILMLDMIIKIIFNGCLIFIIVGHFYRYDRVSRDTISAALIGYVLLTLLWTNLYFLIELMYPNSFTIPHETILADPSIFRYFSFVTITTLGYGDIAPVSSQARNLAVLEAFVGQMYLAILIARLVAIHTSQASEKMNH